MKKFLLIIFITLIFMGLLYSQITVIQPTAGQTVCKGSTLTITWTSVGSPTPNVKIRLRQGAVKILDIHDSTLDDGTYNWPVPGSLANGSYFIRVASTDGAMIGDSPNFTITNCGGTITVTQPIAGQDVCKNNTLTIEWTSSSCPTPNVKIRLRQGGVKILDIHDSTLDDGTYNWPVPGSLASGSYFIRVASTDGAVIGDSPNFTISNCGPSSIKVTSPTSMWSFNAGGGMTVKWRTSGITGNVKITLHKKNDTLVFLVKESHPHNDSPHKYTIPDNLETGKYYIKISQGDIFGKSGNFTIEKQPHTISISHPFPNVSYLKGKVCVIKWHSHNIPDKFVNIWLRPVSSGALKPLVPVAKRVSNNEGRNSYSWKISNSIQDGDYKVFIEDTSRKYSGEGKKFKIIEKHRCDLNIVNAEFCEKNLDVTIKNNGQSFLGDIMVVLESRIVPGSLPLQIGLQKKGFLLFPNKTLTVNFKGVPAIVQCSVPFSVTLIVDRDHLDVNPANNRFSGKAYKDCKIRECDKPDLYFRDRNGWKDVGVVKKYHNSSLHVGQKVKFYCRIGRLGVIRSQWKLKLSFYMTNNSVETYLESFYWDLGDIGREKRIEFTYVPKTNGYLKYVWELDVHNVIRERDETNNRAGSNHLIWPKRD